jgi:hypothetical protein
MAVAGSLLKDGEVDFADVSAISYSFYVKFFEVLEQFGS